MATGNQWPDVHDISVRDIADVLRAGLSDFLHAPQYGLTIGGLFAVAGWLLLILLWLLGLPYFAYPIAMGFALIAPFAAVGFYAVSEHIESGKPLSWSSLCGSVMAAAKRDLRWMALVTGFALVLWMDIAALLFFGFMGTEVFNANFWTTLFTTQTGLIFLLIGNISGALIALGIFSISAVSFPMLYERDVDFVTAMVTSVRLVAANPVTMILWCVIIGGLSVVSVMTAFLGLFVVLPVVGHATWHLYKRSVAPGVELAGAVGSGT